MLLSSFENSVDLFLCLCLLLLLSSSLLLCLSSFLSLLNVDRNNLKYAGRVTEGDCNSGSAIVDNVKSAEFGFEQVTTNQSTDIRRFANAELFMNEFENFETPVVAFGFIDRYVQLGLTPLNTRRLLFSRKFLRHPEPVTSKP
jgi:hypothetical protein